MVPKRSKASGSDQPRPQTSSDVTPPAAAASELAPTSESDTSSKAAPAKTLRLISAADVAEAIERERIELMQIQAMLKCLYEVLLYADDDDSVMHADVANVCARLINDSVGRLDELLIHEGPRDSSDESDEPGLSQSGSHEE
jgi:hypothetical protein